MAPPPNLVGASDQEIVALALEGREDAFTELVRRYRGRVYRRIRRIVGNHERAEDLTQETLFKAVEKLDRYRPERPLAPWIGTIAHNTALDYVRIRVLDSTSWLNTTTPGAIDARPIWAPSPSDTPIPDAEMHRRAVALWQALRGLRPEYRRCLMLREVEGYSYDEIAEVMQLPEGTVGTYLRRARAQLKKKLATLLGSSEADEAHTPA